MASKVRQAIETVLANPARYKVLHSLWDTTCDYFLPKTVSTTAHMFEQDGLTKLAYDLAGSPDGTIDVIFSDTYQVRSTSNFASTPEPGADYIGYPNTIPAEFVSGTLLRVTYPDYDPDIYHYWRVEDLPFTRGETKILIVKFNLDYYRFNHAGGNG